MTNVNKLKGRIAEKGYTLSSLSTAIDLSRPCLRGRINGKSDFKVSEIEKICTVLDIPRSEIDVYFFYSLCPHNGN